MNLKKEELLNKVLKLTCIASVVCLVLAIYMTVYLYRVNPEGSATLYGRYLFSDFAETISYCISRNPYNGIDDIRSIYPPFAYLPFYPFALICKGPLQQMLDKEIPLSIMYKETSFVVSFILFYVINMALILFVSAKMSKFKGMNLVYLLVSIFCFGPFIYAFGRANVIITACLFALIFFWLYNSETKWKRELANLSLACSVAIKIYPAIIAVFFLKDRRFKDLGKTVLYSLILLFVPFLLISEGFGNIKHIWDNFTVFNSGQGRNDDGANISLDSLCYKFFAPISTGFYSTMSSLTRHGLLLLSIVTLLLNKNSKKEMQCMLVSICTYALWQGVSYGYTMTFLIAPIIIYLSQIDKLSKFNKWYYGACFAIIAFPTAYVLKIFIIQSLALVALVVKAIVDLFIERFSKKQQLVNE